MSDRVRATMVSRPANHCVEAVCAFFFVFRVNDYCVGDLSYTMPNYTLAGVGYSLPVGSSLGLGCLVIASREPMAITNRCI